MPQYMVMTLAPGAPVPPEGEPAGLTFVLTTQASATAARTAAAPLLKPAAGQQFWTVDTATLGAPMTTSVSWTFA